MTEHSDASDPADNAESISEDDMRAAVSKVSASKAFAASPKLSDFLSFVADETILKRSDNLRAKTIAYHVYGRDADDATSANVVRVEARRLRRLLEDYYEDEGAGDPLQIIIDKGGYGPRFVLRANDSAAARRATHKQAQSSPGKILYVAAAFAVIGLIGIVTSLVWSPSLDPFDPSDTETARLQREALLELSPAALEAANMADQARGLIWPIFDVERQRLATELFRTAIKADPNSAGAYAGAAQTLASQALMSIQGAQHDAFLAEAREMSERALALAPTDAWSQSAAGWVAFVASDYENALRLSQRAVSLAPDEGNVLDFYGVVGILSGQPELGLDAGSRDRVRVGPNTRFAYLNILGAAHFHTGNFEAAAKAFEDGNANGGPLSALGVIYLAATYQALGRTDDGKRLLMLLEESWPQIPVETVLLRMHRDEAAADEVLNRLAALGW